MLRSQFEKLLRGLGRCPTSFCKVSVQPRFSKSTSGYRRALLAKSVFDSVVKKGGVKNGNCKMLPCVWIL